MTTRDQHQTPRETLAPDYFRALLRGAGLGGVALARVQPAFPRGWVLTLRAGSFAHAVVLDARLPTTAGGRLTFTWRRAPSGADRDDFARVAGTIAERMAAVELPPPTAVLQPPREEALLWESVTLPSFCDRGCLFCTTNTRRVVDPSLPGWGPEAVAAGGLETVRAEADAAWPTIRARLDALAAATPRPRVSWNGNDVLASPLFERALEHAFALGLREMNVQSPGTALADPEFVRRLRARGVTSANLTAHGGTEALFDRIAGKPGAARLFWTALDNLLRSDFDVFVAVPCVSENIDGLAGLLARLAPLPLQIGVYYWHPDPAFETGYAAMPLTMADAAAAIERAVATLPRERVSVSGMPACANALGDATRLRWDLGRGHLEPADFGFAESCAACSLRERCHGIPVGYLRHHPAPAPLLRR